MTIATRVAHRVITGPNADRNRFYLTELGRPMTVDDLLAMRPYRARRRVLAAVRSS